MSLSLPCTGRDTVGCSEGRISYFHLHLYIKSVLNSTHTSVVNIFTNNAQLKEEIMWKRFDVSVFQNYLKFLYICIYVFIYRY